MVKRRYNKNVAKKKPKTKIKSKPKREIKEKVPSKQKLLKIGVPAVLIPGIILAATLGWMGWKNMGNNFERNKKVFPDYGQVTNILDGDTFELKNGVRVRLIGVDAPPIGSGEARSGQVALDELSKLVMNKTVWLEYDRYQDDKYGRILAWVWLGCNVAHAAVPVPEFLPADYMHKSNRESNPGLLNNPKGCENGKLIQEELIKKGAVKYVKYADRGELKYEERLKKIISGS